MVKLIEALHNQIKLCLSLFSYASNTLSAQDSCIWTAWSNIITIPNQKNIAHTQKKNKYITI